MEDPHKHHLHNWQGVTTENCTGQTPETGVESRFSPKTSNFKSLVTQIYMVFLLARHNLS